MSVYIYVYVCVCVCVCVCVFVFVCLYIHMYIYVNKIWERFYRVSALACSLCKATAVQYK
jgi:hypothetical protein